MSAERTEIEGKEPCSWFEIQYLVKELARQIQTSGKKYDGVLGIANGGIIPAKLLAEELGIRDIRLIRVQNKQVVMAEMPPLSEKENYLIIDDIYDTGDTYKKVSQVMKSHNCDYAFCMTRHEQPFGIYGRILNHNRWIVFPWEMQEK